MSRSSPSLGTLIWSGEHWLNYLRPPGAEANSALLSLYHAHYSSAGQGTLAFVDIPDFFTAACTDNPAFARFIIATMIRGSGHIFDRDLPLLEARCERGGDIRTAPSWSIQTANHHIESTWSALHKPLVGPPTIHPDIVFTTFIFANEALVLLNGQKIEGQPYLRESWRQNLGAPHSSAMFALAETMIRTPD